MSLYTSEVRGTFYHRIWQRALAIEGRRWYEVTEQHLGPAGVIALVPSPQLLLTPRQLMAWPVLPEQPEHAGAVQLPGWVPTTRRLEAAYASILRADGPALMRGHVGDEAVRRRLRLAEQHVNADELLTTDADLVLQVAIFGQVVFT